MYYIWRATKEQRQVHAPVNDLHFIIRVLLDSGIALPLHHDPALRGVVDPQQLRRDSRPRVFRTSVPLSRNRKR